MIMVNNKVFPEKVSFPNCRYQFKEWDTLNRGHTVVNSIHSQGAYYHGNPDVPLSASQSELMIQIKRFSGLKLLIVTSWEEHREMTF